ncbi:MAG: NAD(P)H-hydrate epimerase [Neisseria sp.]|nr:NAD(P)H-hydrate epimerase [Neisseria sp.]
MNTTKIYTAAQMRVAENQAVKDGTSLLTLMENAGQGAAVCVLRRFPAMQSVLLVCGKGNNGGDALVMARVFAEHGKRADVVFLLGNTLSDLAQINRERLPASVRILPVHTLDVRHYDVVVDAVFGTGFNGTLPESVADFFRVLNTSDTIKVALDIPSGMNCDTGNAAPESFRAEVTYAFGAYKPAHFMPSAKSYCGEVVPVSIGID